jgi:hypothetical protein
MFPNVRSDQLHQRWEVCQSIIEKFQLALSLRHKPELPTGKSPCQDIKTLIDLRNALTHLRRSEETSKAL